MKLATSPDAVRAPRPDAIEVLMTLSMGQYVAMDHDLEEARQKLNLPKSASNTDVILEAVRRLASHE